MLLCVFESVLEIHNPCCLLHIHILQELNLFLKCHQCMPDCIKIVVTGLNVVLQMVLPVVHFTGGEVS